jgi:hypothetical protein
MPKTVAEVEGRHHIAAPKETTKVNVMVTELGDGKISTGAHYSTGGEEVYEENEEFEVDAAIAAELSKRGLVVILKPKSKPAAAA